MPRLYTLKTRKDILRESDYVYSDVGGDDTYFGTPSTFGSTRFSICEAGYSCCQKSFPSRMTFTIKGGEDGDFLRNVDYWIASKEFVENSIKAGISGLESIELEIDSMYGIPIEEFMEEVGEFALDYRVLSTKCAPLVVNRCLRGQPTNLCQYCGQGVLFCKDCWGFRMRCPECEEKCLVTDESKIDHPAQQIHYHVDREKPVLLDLGKWKGEDLLSQYFPCILTEKFVEVILSLNPVPCVIEELEYETL